MGSCAGCATFRTFLWVRAWGRRAYAIIGQERIGQLLSSKPHDRRAIIEEAAGITRFKTKKRLAELRLEQSKQNLARVNDIFEEVTRQMGSLKRQAAKAERYGALRDELRGRLRVVLASRMAQMDAEQAAVAAEIAALTAQIDEHSATDRGTGRGSTRGAGAGTSWIGGAKEAQTRGRTSGGGTGAGGGAETAITERVAELGGAHCGGRGGTGAGAGAARESDGGAGLAAEFSGDGGGGGGEFRDRSQSRQHEARRAVAAVCRGARAEADVGRRCSCCRRLGRPEPDGAGRGGLAALERDADGWRRRWLGEERSGELWGRSADRLDEVRVGQRTR